MTAVFVGLVLLLNALNAGVGVSVAALGLAAGANGVVIGYFSDRLPDLSRFHSDESVAERHVRHH
jgi:hypothetical protein